MTKDKNLKRLVITVPITLVILLILIASLFILAEIFPKTVIVISSCFLCYMIIMVLKQLFDEYLLKSSDTEEEDYI
ncbi:MAG: hypothetical protein KAS07_01175 [Candidatus Pacebacteria bacterium]|nr:hypothetical protein [Candidatus Paceibacterota bacterium]